jgi:hypothetical protein
MSSARRLSRKHSSKYVVGREFEVKRISSLRGFNRRLAQGADDIYEGSNGQFSTSRTVVEEETNQIRWIASTAAEGQTRSAAASHLPKPHVVCIGKGSPAFPVSQGSLGGQPSAAFWEASSTTKAPLLDAKTLHCWQRKQERPGFRQL